MEIWAGRCQRCYKESGSYIMSMYSDKLVCTCCKEKEVERDDYDRARDAEQEAVRSGDYNFKGIGEPCG